MTEEKKRTLNSCSNCRHNIGMLTSPNSDRIICDQDSSILDGWPHRDYLCEKYQAEDRSHSFEKRKAGLLMPCDFVLRKVVLDV